MKLLEAEHDALVFAQLLFEQKPDDLEIIRELSRLQERLERFDEWLDTLNVLFQLSTEPNEKRDVAQRLFRLQCQHFNAHADALNIARVAVDDLDSFPEEFVAEIENVLSTDGYFEELAEFFEFLSARTDSDAIRCDYLERAGALLVEQCDAPARGAGILERALEIGLDPDRILQRLDDLYALTGESLKRLVVLERRLEQESETIERGRLQLAIASLCFEELEENARALEAVQAVVKTTAHRGAAFELLNRMLVESDAQLAVARTIRDESNAETDVEILVNAFEFLRNNADETSERISAHLSFAEQLRNSPLGHLMQQLRRIDFRRGSEIELLLRRSLTKRHWVITLSTN